MSARSLTTSASPASPSGQTGLLQRSGKRENCEECQRKSGGLAHRSIKRPVSHRTTTPQPTFSELPVLLQDVLQAKLTIGQPGDKYEQEADRVAEQVMRMPEPIPLAGQTLAASGEPPTIQRACSKCRRAAQPLSIEEDEEEQLRAKPIAGQRPTISPTTHPSLSALQGSGQPLPPSERDFFESRFGADFSQVRIHTDNQAADMARLVNARAFTFGRDIVFGAEEYRTGSIERRQLLAHELTHVMQQSSHRIPFLQRWPCRQTVDHGYAEEPGSAEFDRGELIHQILQDEFIDYTLLHSATITSKEYEIPGASERQPGISEGYADLAIDQYGEIYEIKTFSGISYGLAALERYINWANEYCTEFLDPGYKWHGGTDWPRPPGPNYPEWVIPLDEDTELFSRQYLNNEEGHHWPGLVVYWEHNREGHRRSPPDVRQQQLPLVIEDRDLDSHFSPLRQPIEDALNQSPTIKPGHPVYCIIAPLTLIEQVGEQTIRQTFEPLRLHIPLPVIFNIVVSGGIIYAVVLAGVSYLVIRGLPALPAATVTGSVGGTLIYANFGQVVESAAPVVMSAAAGFLLALAPLTEAEAQPSQLDINVSCIYALPSTVFESEASIHLGSRVNYEGRPYYIIGHAYRRTRLQEVRSPLL